MWLDFTARTTRPRCLAAPAVWRARGSQSRSFEGAPHLRLTKASIKGFGRITTGSVDLTPRVIAVVGPNEAGKSTLLDALVYLTDTSTTLAPSRRSRTTRPGDASTVSPAPMCSRRLKRNRSLTWIYRSFRELLYFRGMPGQRLATWMCNLRLRDPRVTWQA